MKLLKRIGACVGFSALLMSCSGGGGDSTSSQTPSAVALNANTFTGHFVSPCFATVSATNLETGAPLYAKLLFSVGAGSGPTAPIEFRLDFFDTTSCTGEAIGILRNTNPSNTLTILSEVNSNGRLASKLRMAFGTANVGFLAGPTADTVTYGTALRLSLPRGLFEAFYINDLWFLDGNNLYEGSSQSGADGFPLSLSASPTSTKLTSAPPLPAAPCASTPVTWYVTGGLGCTANPTPSASNLTQALTNQSFGRAGLALSTCTNGTWSTPDSTASTCTLVGPPALVPVCAAQTITWSEGLQTCSGTTPPAYGIGTNELAANTVPANTGYQFMTCTAGGSWAPVFPGTCAIRPPPPPPITDPLQLAQARNCLACHAVTGKGLGLPGAQYSFPSFQEIANFYRLSPPVQSVLANRIKAGSVGVFGTTPMPANPQASDDDLAILIPWILAQPQ